MSEKKRGTALCKPKYKIQKVARVTNNGYLNFLTEYKKRFWGLSPKDMVRFGARQWNQLTVKEKKAFKNMEPVSVVISAPQEFESQSLGQTPDNSEQEKRGPIRSPTTRDKKSKIKKEKKPSKPKKGRPKKKPSPVPKNCDQSPLGSAVAFIHYMRMFQKKNPNLSGPELLNKGARVWCNLSEGQRKQFELNLKVYKRSNGYKLMRIV
ncbi:protamine-like protein 99C isoform X2 [Drosophila biarmipes]|uniref:protamine-like protein 99C isoform X2 n=1 Tax=Drosophila biarmipes TaxID=125945 RepID=UPI0007E83B83|nr:protamine-like protein 99C isoform X2 [Drosophila biarmipes]